MSASNSQQLKGRVALITGASSGIGAATARLFAAAGASLVLNGRDPQRLKNVADAITKANPTVKVVTYIGDAGLEATHKALVDLALSSFGALHIVFNNAGGLVPGLLTSVDAKSIDTQFDGNVKSVIFGLKHQIPAIGKSATKDNWGVIINNSSIVANRIKTGMAGVAVYAASKAAVDTLTKYGALEGAEHFVRVNSVNPGYTSSEGAVNLSAGGSTETFAKNAESALLVSAPATPEEIAQFVLFLADNKTGRFFSGSNLLIDGGVNVK